MHFRHFSRMIAFFSVVVSSSIDYSDFIQPDDGLEALLVDPNAPPDSNAPFDSNMPLFDGVLSTSDPLAWFDQSTDLENTSLDMSWDDSFKPASCSALSRVRRTDDSGSCPDVNPSDEDQLIDAFQQGKYSLTCTLLTANVLPFALIASIGPNDVILNMNTLNSVATIGLGPRLYYPSTLYRATLSTKFSSQCFAIQLMLT